MAIKKPLEMKNGVQVRNITDLKENFDIEKIISYFLNGKLMTWLQDRYYEEEEEAVSKLSSNDSELAKKLCEIFGVEYETENQIDVEKLTRRNERLTKLKQFTDDSEIIKNIDFVAFNQEELADLYDNDAQKIYLCEGEFCIPKSKNHIDYIIVGYPKVKRISEDERKILGDEKKCTDQASYLKSKPNREDYLFEKLADMIGWNDYVVSDDYVVFSNSNNSFEDDLPTLHVDEAYYEESDNFKVWDIKMNKLSSFKLTGYENYDNLIAVTDSKVILSKSYSREDVLVYDICNKRVQLTCENWNGNIKSISVSNKRIAYIDNNYNLYCVDLDLYKKEFIDNLNYENKCILIKEDKLIYLKEDCLFEFDFFDRQKKNLKKIEVSVDELMLSEDKLYVINLERNFIVLEMDLIDDEKNLKEIFNIGVSSWERKTVKKGAYFILLKEESGYPVYAFNANLGTVKKILSDCGYTESESHFFKSTDYFHYGYYFCVVGNYFFYNKSKHYSFNKNYYRLNMLTGEITQEKARE